MSTGGIFIKKVNGPKQQPEENINGINISLLKATADLLVLFLLRQKSMYTYEMANEMERISKGKLKLQAIYHTIYKLKSLDLIEESGKVVSEDNRIRVYFSITEKGSVVFDNMRKEYYSITNCISDVLMKDGVIYAEGES